MAESFSEFMLLQIILCSEESNDCFAKGSIYKKKKLPTHKQTKEEEEEKKKQQRRDAEEDREYDCDMQLIRGDLNIDGIFIVACCWLFLLFDSTGPTTISSLPPG